MEAYLDGELALIAGLVPKLLTGFEQLPGSERVRLQLIAAIRKTMEIESFDARGVTTGKGVTINFRWGAVYGSFNDWVLEITGSTHPQLDFRVSLYEKEFDSQIDQAVAHVLSLFA